MQQQFTIQDENTTRLLNIESARQQYRMPGANELGQILDSSEKNSGSEIGIQKELEDENQPYGATPSRENIKLKSPSVKSLTPISEVGGTEIRKGARIQLPDSP